MKCIKVNALFELVALIQKDIDAEQGAPDSICAPVLIFCCDFPLELSVSYCRCVGTIAGTESAELDITSHAIQKYFTDERHPIVPWKHSRYQHFYVDGEPEIALTYQWSMSFRQIKAFLDPRNIAMHNHATVDPGASVSDELPVGHSGPDSEDTARPW